MSLRATHKKLISVFLITLYAFIVTPTQWWHHHEMDTKQTSLSTQKNKHTNTVQDAVGLNCKICSHHYSIADNNAGSLLMQHPIFTASQYCSTPPDQYLQFFLISSYLFIGFESINYFLQIVFQSQEGIEFYLSQGKCL